MTFAQRLATSAAALLLSLSAGAQGQMVRDFAPACDSLKAGLQRRTTVRSALRLTKVMKRGESLDFYFNQSLLDYPWREADLSWLRATLKEHFDLALVAAQDLRRQSPAPRPGRPRQRQQRPPHGQRLPHPRSQGPNLRL